MALVSSTPTARCEPRTSDQSSSEALCTMASRNVPAAWTRTAGAAPDPRLGGVAHGSGAGGGPGVDVGGQRLTAGGPDRGRHLLCRSGVGTASVDADARVVDAHRVAGVGQREGDGPADAAAAAGDDAGCPALHSRSTVDPATGTAGRR